MLHLHVHPLCGVCMRRRSDVVRGEFPPEAAAILSNVLHKKV
jgi:hypothetical protein